MRLGSTPIEYTKHELEHEHKHIKKCKKPGSTPWNFIDVLVLLYRIPIVLNHGASGGVNLFLNVIDAYRAALHILLPSHHT